MPDLGQGFEHPQPNKASLGVYAQGAGACDSFEGRQRGLQSEILHELCPQALERVGAEVCVAWHKQGVRHSEVICLRYQCICKASCEVMRAL